MSLNNTCSNLHNVTCGIPQGYVLGPLLFFIIIYINDFHNSSDLFDFYHFVDDSNLFYKHKNIIDLQANVELNNISTWLCANKRSLNIEKSNFVIFHLYQRKLPIDINLTYYTNIDIHVRLYYTLIYPFLI